MMTGSGITDDEVRDEPPFATHAAFLQDLLSGDAS